MEILPNLIIIGAAKSASTFMHSCLREHPAVFMLPGETSAFESPDYEQGGVEKLRAELANRSERCIGIKRPSYIGRPEVPSRIVQHVPDAKLVAVLRDPVARAVSAYYHYMIYGFIPAIDINVGLNRILDCGELPGYPRSREILEFGMYSKYLSLYRHFFERAQILVHLHEEVATDPREAMRRTFQFLDIDPAFTPPSIYQRYMEGIYSMPRIRLLRLRNVRLFEYNHDRTRLYLKRADAWHVATRAISAFDRYVLSFLLPNKPRTLTSAIRARLQSWYAADIASLENILERRLDMWGGR